MLEDPTLLLEAHEKIQQLDMLKDAVMMEVVFFLNPNVAATAAATASRNSKINSKLNPSESNQSEEKTDLIPIFENYFKMIGDITTKFFDQVWIIVEDVIELCQEDPAMVIRAVRVIEREEAMDRDIAQRVAAAVASGNAAGSKRLRKPRGYLDQFNQHIEKSISEKFTDCMFSTHQKKKNKIKISKPFPYPFLFFFGGTEIII